MAGIEVTNQWANLEQYAQAGQNPVGIISRGREEEWQVAMSPIEAGKPMEWGLAKDGDAVYVPLVPYRVSTEPEEAFAFLLETGVLAGIQVNMTRGPIKRIHLIRGCPVEDLRPEADAFRFWAGLAIRIK
jgi:hypothetical protein